MAPEEVSGTEPESRSKNEGNSSPSSGSSAASNAASGAESGAPSGAASGADSGGPSSSTSGATPDASSYGNGAGAHSATNTSSGASSGARSSAGASSGQGGGGASNKETSFVRVFTNQLQGWLKDSNPELHSNVESAIESAAQMADQGLANAKAAGDMLAEFASDLTGVESFKVIPKSSMALEVDIRCKQEQDIVVKQQIAPFVELQALHLGRQVNFEALINHTEKGLQLDINRGMSLKIVAPLIGLQTIDIKGSGMLTRDDRGQLVLMITTTVPGLSNPVTVALPMNNIFRDVQTHIKKKFTNER